METALKLSLPKSKTSPKDIPKCAPNLMPFHISHTGHAPISTYFLPKPAPPSILVSENSGNLSSENTLESETQTTTETLETVTSASTTTIAVSETQISDSDATLTVNEQTQSTTNVIEKKSMLIPQSAVKRLSSTAKRLMASFRGRGMHGVEVELPQGYVGILLGGPPSGEVDSLERGRSSRFFKNREKGKSAKGSARPRRGAKEVVEVEDGMEVDEDGEKDVDGIRDGEEEGMTRTLEVAGRFDSFVLWHPDFPVDEGRDEYLRTLTEWVALSAEVRRKCLIHSFVSP